MKFNKILHSLFGCLIIVACVSKTQATSLSSNELELGTVPLLILDDMKKNDCAPIQGYYTDRLVVDPPFFRYKPASYVYLCQASVNANSVNYKLVISSTQTEESEFKGCTQAVNLNTMPSGVTVQTKKISNKHFFEYMGTTAMPKKADGESQKVILISTNDGGFLEFSCSQGKWYVFSYA